MSGRSEMRQPVRTPMLVALALSVVGVCQAQSAGGLKTTSPVILGWEPAAELAQARQSHTATRLGNGRVLVAGGSGPIVPTYPGGATFGVLDSAEYFIPDVGIWRTVAPMSAKRTRHTATLLDDNSVLVVGGGADTPERFSPVTESWSPTHPMRVPRSGHTATLLADGRVLTVGGHRRVNFGAIVYLAEAEIFDPGSGVWTTTGSMSVKRSDHAATLLMDGRVLVTGGTLYDAIDGEWALRHVEIYDPATGMWTRTGDLQVERDSHSAVLLADGRVLIAGGVQESLHKEILVEVIDPSGGPVTVVSDPKRGFNLLSIDTVTSLEDGTVLVTGNNSATGQSNGEGKLTQVYNPIDNGWKTVGSMNERRKDDTATLLRGGKVLAVGGYTDHPVTGVLASAELFSVAIDHVVEYYHAPLDHYFITASRAERDALDAGAFKGWVRTGEGFPVWMNRVPPASIGLVHPPGLLDVCRAYIPPSMGDSHFYSASTEECAKAQEDLWFETSSAFLATLPDTVSGACTVGQTPIYRLWNNRVDSNHRYTASVAVRDSMVARGYVPEGYGPGAVALCVGDRSM